MGFNDQLKIVRNYRGLLPEDMNHCTKDIEDFEERAQLKRLVENERADPMGIMSRETLKRLIRNQNNNSRQESNVTTSEEFDEEPDYIFLIKGTWAPVLISELMLLNLRVTEILSKSLPLIQNFRSGKL